MASNVLYAINPEDKKCPLRCTAAGELFIDDSSNPIGDGGNLYTGNIEKSSFSTEFLTDYKYRNCILSYIDTTYDSKEKITVWGSITNTGRYIYLGFLEPTQIRSGLRFASININVGPVRYIKLYNEDTKNTVANVMATLLSS
jgi:hypothetical protein